MSDWYFTARARSVERERRDPRLANTNPDLLDRLDFNLEGGIAYVDHGEMVGFVFGDTIDEYGEIIAGNALTVPRSHITPDVAAWISTHLISEAQP